MGSESSLNAVFSSFASTLQVLFESVRASRQDLFFVLVAGPRNPQDSSCINRRSVSTHCWSLNNDPSDFHNPGIRNEGMTFLVCPLQTASCFPKQDSKSPYATEVTYVFRPWNKDLSPESFFGRQIQEIQIESEEHKTKRRNKPGRDELMRRSLL